ncbi:MAG: helix-turn-helix transcriptional regulator [Gemmatimonadales bacterium]
MSETSAEQANRIVSLVAELTRADDRGGDAPTFAQVAQRFEVPVAQIQRDLRALTMLGESAESEWLMSLSAYQEGDRVVIRSGGPYRRPIRFTSEELVAMRIGLAEEGLEELSQPLADVLFGAVDTDEELPYSIGERMNGHRETVELVAWAIRNRRRVELLYAGEGASAASSRVIDPYQIVEYSGRSYLVSWCETAGEWRNFRADRVLEARLAGGEFALRDDFTPVDDPSRVFYAPDDSVDNVNVRFSATVAPWILERYPDARRNEDGSVEVTYVVADRQWLVRHLLQYGAEAEVVEPDLYRQVLRRAVG